jgi:two-component SAPR family response regulator
LDDLRSQLEATISSKQEYQDALEAMHCDLKDAEAEIEQLKEINDKNQKSGILNKGNGHSLMHRSIFTF